MNKSGIAFLPAILVIAVLFGGGAVVGNAVGLFGTANEGQACLIPPTPCNTGLICADGICKKQVGFVAWFDRLIGQFSLQKILCGNAPLLAGISCNVSIPFVSFLIGALVFAILAILIIGIPEAVYILGFFGGIIGIAASWIFQLYWWIIIIVAVVIGLIAWMVLQK